MKISEAIQKLIVINNEIGDADIVKVVEDEDFFRIEYGCIFDIIQIPDENDKLGPPVVSFMEPIEDESPIKPKFELKRIK